jgi:hypothetical protein
MKFWTLCIAVVFLYCLPASVSAQCTPNPNPCKIEDPNNPACIDPDSVEFIVGKEGSQTIQLLLGRTVPTGLPIPKEIYLSSMTVLSVDRMPAGLSIAIYSANPSDDINGKNNGRITPKDSNTPMYMCAVISGTTTDANAKTDSIEIVANVGIKLMGTNGQPTGDEIDPNSLRPGTNPFRFRYRIASVTSSSVAENIKGFGNMTLAVSPNPADAMTQLRFFTPKGGDVNVIITDLQGKVVYNENFPALDAGDHLLPIPTHHLVAGVYTVQLKAFDTVLTQKFVK